MRVSEPPLDFNEYYRDSRFAKKKARAGSWQERCGDNIYFREAGRWVQAAAFHHTTTQDKKKDTRHPRVISSDYFFYFGEKAKPIPSEFASLLKIGRGCSYHEGKTVHAFIRWLTRKYRPGLIGQPRDREEDPCALGDREC